MTEAVAEQVVEDDVGIADAAPAVAPADEALHDGAATGPGDTAPTPAEPDELDQLLAEYDRAAPVQPQQQQADPLHSRESNQAAIDAGVAAQWEAERERAHLRQEFEGHCAKLQERLPEYVPDDYARSQLLAMSVENPQLETAFQAQAFGIHPAAAAAELDKVAAALVRAKLTGADPQQIRALEHWGWQLQVACNARVIMARAESAIVKKASRPPIDRDATETRMAVAAAVRGAGGRVPEEPPPDLGRMSEQQFREYKSQFGF